MILVDANVLLYAYNTVAPQHEVAKGWLENAFSEPAPVCLSWSAILAFIRIGTSPKAFKPPLAVNTAREIVSTWLARPNIVVLEPGERHWAILGSLFEATQARANLITDAHLAALAIEHGASLCTTDSDFARFERHGLRIVRPAQRPE